MKYKVWVSIEEFDEATGEGHNVHDEKVLDADTLPEADALVDTIVKICANLP